MTKLKEVLLSSILFLLLSAPVYAQQTFDCTFLWDAPTSDTQGNPVAPQGYRLYKRVPSETYVKGQFTYDVLVAQLIDPLNPRVTNVCHVGDVWVVSAYYRDANNVLKESAFSNQWTVTANINRPVRLRVNTQTIHEQN